MMTGSQKLELLADWFDRPEAKNQQWSGEKTVQEDLRRIAKNLKHRKKLEQQKTLTYNPLKDIEID